MINRTPKRKNVNTTISLIVVVWISVAFSFPLVHHRRTAGASRFTARSPSSQRFAFSWFKDSPEADKSDNDLASHTDTHLSENLSDATNAIERSKTSRRIGEQTGKALHELSYTFVEGIAADGKVKVTFNGQQIPIGVEVDESYLNDMVSERGKDGVDELCLALTNAMQEAHYKSGIKVEEKMKSVYSDLEFGT
jgi:DNA-binding protein YbaB